MCKKTQHVTFIQITNKCNARCLMCDCWKKKQYDYPINILKQLIIKIINKYPESEIRLTGGEPCLHSNFSDIISFLIKNRIKTSIITNGTLFKKKYSKYKFYRIFLSVDSPYDEDQLEIRNINVNSLLPTYNKNIIANIIFSEINKSIISHFPIWLYKNNITTVNIIPMKEKKYSLSSNEFYEYLRDFISEADKINIKHFIEGKLKEIEIGRVNEIINQANGICKIQDIVDYFTINGEEYSCNSLPHRVENNYKYNSNINLHECETFNDNYCDISNILYNSLNLDSE